MGNLFIGLVVSALLVTVSLCASFGAGVVYGLKSLEHTQLREVKDGKENFYITFWLGPFSYRINVKERQITHKGGNHD